MDLLLDMDILKYMDYKGSAEIDMSLCLCYSKILFIDDVVTFEAAVDDYLKTCKELNRQPQEPLKGQFNVRISPELHRAVCLKSLEEHTSLNDIIVRALQAFIPPVADVRTG